MKGKHKVIVKNNRLHYEFEIKRNITIIKGDSATGKTTLINMVRQFADLGNSSGIDIVCDVPCRVLEGSMWQILLQNMVGSIIFIDEENYFIRTKEFAEAVKASDNYFVIITRENLYNLPYSVEEIYGLHSSGKYQNTQRVYQEMSFLIKLYLPESFEWIILSSGLVEDKEVKGILEAPENYIESQTYFSWERFFTKLLVDKTEGTYLKYQKSKLNLAYLHEKNKRIILEKLIK